MDTKPQIGIRRASRPVDQYLLISNAFARSNLKPRAKVVVLYLLSHSEGFVVTQTRMAKVLGISVTTVAAALEDLEGAGLLMRRTVHGENGAVVGTEYVVSDTPMDLNVESTGRSDLNVENLDRENLDRESTGHKKTTSEKKINEQKNPPGGDGSADAPTAEPGFSAGEVVGAYHDAFKARTGSNPVRRVLAQIGREAKKLLDEGRTPADVVAAAQALAETPYATLERQFMMRLAGTPTGGASWSGRGSVDEFGRGITDATRMSQEAAAYWATKREAEGIKEPDYDDEYYANKPTGLAF